MYSSWINVISKYIKTTFEAGGEGEFISKQQVIDAVVSEYPVKDTEKLRALIVKSFLSLGLSLKENGFNARRKD